MKQGINVRSWASLRGTLLILLIAGISWAVLLRPQSKAAASISNAGSTACPTGKRCIFLPSVSKPGAKSTGDLVLSGIEVNQSVQDASNSVPLVAGRPTILRIYTNASSMKTAVPNVKVTVTATNISNSLLAGSPRAYTTTVPLSSSRSNYASTLNIQLPSGWLSGTVHLTVNIDADNRISEKNEGNNRLTKTLVFKKVPALRIMVVPIRYSNTSSGRTYPAPTVDTVSDWIRRTYPISQLQITWHAPYGFTGNLSTADDFSRLLNEITSLKSTEGAPSSQVYYGLIPTVDGGSTWFYSGIAGLGWVGARTAIGLDLAGQTSQIAAHEVGHNLGMSHTPCGVSSGTEPNFPYKDGTIGQYGLDVSAGKLYSPTTKDVMSYCSPKWISDYTYKEIFSDQQANGASAAANSLKIEGEAAKRGLLVRANIRPDGAALLPVYILPGGFAQNPPAGEYQVQVLGENGETLVDLPVRAFEAQEEGDIHLTAINTMIPLPEAPAATLRLLKDGQVLAEQQIQSVSASRAPTAKVEQAVDGYQVTWAAKKTPSLVRYSTDGGKTWVMLGIDVTDGKVSAPEGAVSTSDGKFEIIPAGSWK